MSTSRSRASRAKRPAQSDASRLVKAYLAKLDTPVRRRLTQMRTVIRAAAPRAVEHFSYGIPAFRLNDRPLVGYAAFKGHTSLFPMTKNIRKKYETALTGYETSAGTVRFPLATPLPMGLVQKLVKARAAEVRAANHPWK